MSAKNISTPEMHFCETGLAVKVSKGKLKNVSSVNYEERDVRSAAPSFVRCVHSDPISDAREIDTSESMRFSSVSLSTSFSPFAHDS